ncbi:uncharacterized protein TM35_000044600 [Trypanosoma theileri]|uniref:Uncharacterized protein n=1 Tax=Trypanosoma theileri TaxID=67003 RepID=A0A1X0P5M8_9TRYP|nr:uncharacterized protein TM35_000044600 [Trypanosoma theileri]ORC92246.1 hypothetical protein TM35_000044600 [Trypanosoma theileri]
MRRAALLLLLPRPTAPLRCKHTLALRPTRVLCIHPQLVRLLVAGGVLLFQAFAVAHSQEARKLREEAEGTSSPNTTVGSSHSTIMSSAEALRVLGLNAELEVPLKNETDRQEAHWRFKRLFAIAKESDNLYLQGKFSAAYRLCVDADWDAAGDHTTSKDRTNIDSSG